MIEQYAHFFETLTPTFAESEFKNLFTDDAVFADPFQHVQGVDKIISVFRHMYTTLNHPHFDVIETIGDNEKGYIRWRFYYNESSFEGISHVRFDSNGRVCSHIDYWDAASNVYEKIPLLGSLLRAIKKRLILPQS